MEGEEEEQSLVASRIPSGSKTTMQSSVLRSMSILPEDSTATLGGIDFRREWIKDRILSYLGRFIL